MQAFVWNERFRTGLDDVDTQHRGLVDLINRVGELTNGDRVPDAAIVQDIFRELVAYAHLHFDTEETLMARSQCDPRHVGQHKREHHGFMSEIRSMNTASGADTPAAMSALFNFLASWLAYHMLGADHAMARQIAAIEQGASPAEAFDRNAASRDPVSAALLDALGNLVNLVASRNLALGEMQDMLRRANLGLEANVEARTRELARANAELTALVERLEAAQHQLLQSEKMASIGLLAAGVAHEINNPIGFVNSNLGTLKRYIDGLLEVIGGYEEAERELPAGTRSSLAALKEQADLEYLRTDILKLMEESSDGLNRVTRIVQDLKEFSHVDSSEWMLADLKKGLESTLNLVWNEIKYKAKVINECGELPPVLCVPEQLNQVFMNLLVNAAHAIAESGTITLRSGVEGDRVWIEVEDTGCGMPAEVQNRIFEPFFTTKPVGKGTGLGLSLAYGIVQKHGGSIEVESRPGVGSRFRVWLPLRGTAPEQADADPADGAIRG